MSHIWKYCGVLTPGPQKNENSGSFQMSKAKLTPEPLSAPIVVSRNVIQLEQSPSAQGQTVSAGSPALAPYRSLSSSCYCTGRSDDFRSRLACAMIEAMSALVASPY